MCNHSIFSNNSVTCVGVFPEIHPIFRLWSSLRWSFYADQLCNELFKLSDVFQSMVKCSLYKCWFSLFLWKGFFPCPGMCFKKKRGLSVERDRVSSFLFFHWKFLHQHLNSVHFTIDWKTSPQAWNVTQEESKGGGERDSVSSFLFPFTPLTPSFVSPHSSSDIWPPMQRRTEG